MGGKMRRRMGGYHRGTTLPEDKWEEFRELEERARAEGWSCADLAGACGVSVATVERWRRRLREERMEEEGRVGEGDVRGKGRMDDGEIGKRWKEMARAFRKASGVELGEGEAPEEHPLSVRWNWDKSIRVIRLHYTADPSKDTDEWREYKRAQQPTPEHWAREYEIDYSVASGGPVFKAFDPAVHVVEYRFNHLKPVLRGWDFGMRRPCVVWTQMNGEQWVVLGCFMGKDIGIQEFAKQILERSAAWFPSQQYVDFCDAAGVQRNDTGMTSVEVLNSLDIYPTWRKLPVAHGIEIINQKLLNRLSDGQPELVVSRGGPGTHILIDMFLGGYHYQEVRPNHPVADEPRKDGYYEHVADSLRYVAVGRFSVATYKYEMDPEKARLQRIKRERVEAARRRAAFEREWRENDRKTFGRDISRRVASVWRAW